MRADVLVVDDDLDIRLTLCELLRDEGYQVAEVAEADAIVDAVEETQPWIVLLDLTMPRFNVPETLAQLRGAGWFDKTTFLALSGLEDASEYARRLGLHGSVGKPFDVEDLLARIATILGERGARAGEAAPPPA